MLAHLEELQIEKAVVMSSGETEGAMASVSGNQKCRELARRFPENMYGCVIWMKIVKKPLKRGSGNIKGREL